MPKKRVLLLLLIIVNILIIGSFFLPYRIEENFSWRGNSNIPEFVHLSGFKTVVPLFCFVFLIPINILFFTTKYKSGRIINLILAILHLVFSGLSFIIVSFSLFSFAKAGIGAYILILCALLVLILAIVHLRMPTIGKKDKDLLDDF